MQIQGQIKSSKNNKQKVGIDKVKANSGNLLDIQHYNVIKAAINGRVIGYVTAQKSPAA